MEANAVLLDGFGRVRDSLHRTLPDLTAEELVREPHPPIGWLAWRTSRVWDSNVSRLEGGEQAWIADGWYARFNMEPNPRDFGPGLSHTREQVAAFRPASAQLVLDYHDTVFERTKAYVAGLTPADLDRELDEPQYDPRVTLAVRLVSLVEVGMANAGQIVYLKSMLRHGGWFPVEQRPPG